MTTTKKVLVAQDQPMDVFLLKRAFATVRVPTTLHFVVDGQEAVDYLSGADAYANRTMHSLPDLMLLDVKMPRLDGFQVLDSLRKQPSLKRMPVIMFSNFNLARDIGLTN